MAEVKTNPLFYYLGLKNIRLCRIYVYMLFIEAPIFTKHIYDYLDDEEYSALQQTIALRPDVGKIIPGSGGLRKVALGRIWSRKTWWTSHNLLLVAGRWARLVTYHIC